MNVKTCSRCRETKPLGDFNKDRTRADGHSYLCKECQRRLVKESEQRHPHAVRARHRRKSGTTAKRQRDKRAIDDLRPWYVRKLLQARTVVDLPRELVQLKAEQLRLSRLAKEMKTAIDNAKDHP